MNEKIKQFQQETRNKVCAFLSNDAEDLEDYCRLQFDMGYTLLTALSRHDNKDVEAQRRAYLTTNQAFWSWWQADYAQHDHLFLLYTKPFQVINLDNYEPQAPTKQEKWLVYQYCKHLHAMQVKAPNFFKDFIYNP